MKKVVICARSELSKNLVPILEKNNCEIVREVPFLSRGCVADFISLKPDVIIISEYVQIDQGMSLINTLHQIKAELTVQIIVLCKQRQPGDRVLQALINVNVYDFIAANEYNVDELLALIKKPRTYNDVAAYHQPVLDSGDGPLSVPENGTTVLREKEVVEVVREVEVEKQVVKEVIREVPVMKKGLKDTILITGWQNSGKSLIAANLSTLLAKLGAKVAVVDGNETNNELYYYFELDQKHDGLKTLLTSKVRYQTLDSAGKPMERLWVFAKRRESAPELKKGSLLHIQDQLREDVDFIIIDAGSNHSPFMQDAAKMASKIYVVIEPNGAKVFDYKKTLSMAQEQGINMAKFSLVLNRYLDSKIIGKNEIEEVFEEYGIRVIATIPPMYPIASESQTTGKPILAQKQGEIFKASFLPMAEMVWGTSNKKKGILGFMSR